MAFTTYNAPFVASPAGKPSLCYIARNDINQIAVLDTVSEGPVDFAVYWCHPFTGDEQNRDSRKKSIRINVFGEGTINPALGSAYIVVICDESRSDVYPFGIGSPQPSGGILWSQLCLNTAGRQIDICLLLTGTAIKVRAAEWQYSTVG